MSQVDDPQVIAEYRILREVGHGGMGKVYAAQHPRLPRQDALKVLPAGYSNDPMFRARFEREAQLASSLEHPNIVPVYDCGSDNGRLWISMRLINGPTAAQLISQSEGGLAPEMVILICTAVARALDFAHSRNSQHRDVKPENILIDMSSEPPHVMLSDFGIARVVGDTSLSSTGLVIGTVDYSAPEHLQGLDTDGRADQYSLACTAAYLLTGRKPFASTVPGQYAVMARHLTGELPKVSETRPDLSPAVDAVFHRAMATDPNNRFRSCIEFVHELDRALRLPARRVPLVKADDATVVVTADQLRPTGNQWSEPTLVRGWTGPTSPPAPPKNRLPLILGILGVVVVLAAAGLTAVLINLSDDPNTTSAPVLSSVSAAPPPTTTSTPERQQYSILDTNRRALDPCKLPANLLIAGGMNVGVKSINSPEIMLCEGTFTGRAPTILMGGYVAGSDTANWVIQQYNRGSPAFADLSGWRRYDATDRENPITRCKYGFVSQTQPQFAFELTVVRTPTDRAFGAAERAAACNRLANVARAIDPAMQHR